MLKNLSWLTVLLTAVILCSAKSASADLTSGLVAYYPFNGNANDESGNGNNGILRGTPQYIDGVKGKALLLNGSTDYIEIPDNPSLNPSSVTVSAWFKINSLDGAGVSCNWQSIVFKESPLSADNHYYAVNIGTGGMQPPLLCANTWLTWGNVVNSCSNDTMQLNNWYHVVATFDSNEIRIYVDGILKDARPTGAPLPIGHKPLFIGYTGMWCGWFFNGTIDDVRIYNRVLPETEVQELYRANSPQPVSSNQKIALLVNDKNLLDSDESHIRQFFASNNLNYTIVDSLSISTNQVNMDDYDVLYMRTGKMPSNYNNYGVIDKIKSRVNKGGKLILEYYGTYLGQYLGVGSISSSSWGPVVLDAAYFVDKKTDSPIFKDIYSWSPPALPDNNQQLIAKLNNPGSYTFPVLRFNSTSYSPQYYTLITTYGWNYQNTNTEYCLQHSGVCTSDRGVYTSGNFEFIKVGLGSIYKLGLNIAESVPASNLTFGPAASQIRKNALSNMLMPTVTFSNDLPISTPPTLTPPEDTTKDSGTLRYYSNDGFKLDRPTVVITHGMNSDTTSWITDIANRIGTSANIYLWDWRDKAKSHISLNGSLADIIPYDNVTKSGEDLAKELSKSLDTLSQQANAKYSNKIQLIGHSLGTMVISDTVSYLYRNKRDYFNLVDQITLLDSAPFIDPQQPLSISNLAPYIKTVYTLADKKNNIFIDNYTSATGVFNPLMLTFADTNIYLVPRTINVHGYAYDWYNSSIDNFTNPSKLGDTSIPPFVLPYGFYWSSVKGGDRSTVRNVFVNDYPWPAWQLVTPKEVVVEQIGEVTYLTEVVGNWGLQKINVLTDYAIKTGAKIKVVTINTLDRAEDAATFYADKAGHAVWELGQDLNGYLKFHINSDVIVHSDIDVPANVNAMRFSFGFLSADAGGLLETFINDVRVSSAQTDKFLGLGVQNSDWIDVSPDAGKRIKLSFRLSNPIDGKNGVAIVDDIIFADITLPQVHIWQDIATSTKITKSTTLYDRINNSYYSYLSVKNTGTVPLNGPVRMVIANPSIPLKTNLSVGLKPDGYTAAGEPYFNIVPQAGILAAGASISNLRVNFEVQRVALTYGVRIEQYK